MFKYIIILFNIIYYQINLSYHALKRARQRSITSDMIKAAINGGKITRFGKNNVKFIKKYKRFTLICVGKIEGREIKTFTVELK